MIVNTIKECFENRLLREISPDVKKSEKSVEVAIQRIEKSKKAFDLKIWEYVVLESYMAMFHVARAVLFRDGIQEKNHYAVYIYLKEKYANKIPMTVINLLNIHRGERHESMYGLEYNPSKKDAESALEDAKLFIENIGKVLPNGK